MGNASFIIVRTLFEGGAGSKPLAQLVTTDSEMDNGLKFDIFDPLRYRVGHFRLA